MNEGTDDDDTGSIGIRVSVASSPSDWIKFLVESNPLQSTRNRVGRELFHVVCFEQIVECRMTSVYVCGHAVTMTTPAHY